MAVMQQKSFGEISRSTSVPLLEASAPMVLKPDRLGWTVHIGTPEAAKQFFLKTGKNKGHDIYPKANMTSQKGALLNDFIGTQNIVFANEKEEWRKHRKLVNPAFHKAKPVKIFGNLVHKVFKVMDKANETPLNITTTYLLFIPFLDKYFLWLLPERRQKHKLLNQFHEILNEVIEKKRKNLRLKYERNGNKFDDNEEKDLLTLMMEGEFTGEGELTDEELKSNLNVFFLAGHDTTANALSFAIYYLARDPVIQRKARDEAIQVLGDEPRDVLPTLEDIKQFDYINQVIKETLRFNGPAPVGLPRKVSKDTELSGVYLPKGTPVVVNSYDLHHNPRVWHDPEVFDPSRFAAGGEAESAGGMAWSPFYNGQRMCIGMQFSLEEQRVMLSCLLRKYEWRLPENTIHKEEVITSPVGILSAKNLEVIFKRRY
ncbi:cytochrome P-450 cyp509A1 [Absidia repens]|uniref:Cytochrome P-450 cyp509A1 n=1 Tax=Absidia repens TaxID=90262 RepID=A0A1X2IYG9_9FUNG|nr:cytochrome P-450 cyp509A1 [Absidia repens]